MLVEETSKFIYQVQPFVSNVPSFDNDNSFCTALERTRNDSEAFFATQRCSTGDRKDGRYGRYGFLSRNIRGILLDRVRTTTDIPGEEFNTFIYRMHSPHHNDTHNCHNTHPHYGFLSSKTREILFSKIVLYDVASERQSKEDERMVRDDDEVNLSTQECNETGARVFTEDDVSCSEIPWSDSDGSSITDDEWGCVDEPRHSRQCSSTDVCVHDEGESVGPWTKIDTPASDIQCSSTDVSVDADDLPTNSCNTIHETHTAQNTQCPSTDSWISDEYVNNSQNIHCTSEELWLDDAAGAAGGGSFKSLEESFKSLQDAYLLLDPCKGDEDANKNTDDGYSSIDPWDDGPLNDERLFVIDENNGVASVESVDDKDSPRDVCVVKRTINESPQCNNTIPPEPPDDELIKCVQTRPGTLQLANIQSDQNKGREPTLEGGDDDIERSSSQSSTDGRLKDERHFIPSHNETELKYKYIEPPVTPPPIAIDDLEEATKLKDDENVVIIERSGERRRGSLPRIDQTLSVSWAESVESIHSDSDVELFVNDADEVELLELVDKDLEKTLNEEERRGQSTEVIKQKRLSMLLEEGDDDCEPFTMEVKVTDGRRLNKFQAIANMFS